MSCWPCFNQTRTFGNAAYVEKLVEVEGNVKEITLVNGQYAILLKGTNEHSHI
ncbi:MAG: hypothetical protein AAGD17_07090 [Bacteroidota bacterium]